MEKNVNCHMLLRYVWSAGCHKQLSCHDDECSLAQQLSYHERRIGSMHPESPMIRGRDETAARLDPQLRGGGTTSL